MIAILKIILFLPLTILNFIDKKKDTNKVDKKDRFGIVGYCGLAGEGKTMCMTRELNRLRKKYGNDIIIITNYFYKYQDEPFTSLEQLYKDYDKTVIVAWDELPDDFNSREFDKFPFELVSKLTQLRKVNGMKILFSAQDFGLVDITFRRLTSYVVQCRTFKERFTYYKMYEKNDYEQYRSSVSVDRKSKILPVSSGSFLQNEHLRSSYDSYQVLKNRIQKNYITRTERARLR